MLDIDKDLKWKLWQLDNHFSDYSERELLLISFIDKCIIKEKNEELKKLVLLCSFVIVIMLCWILLVLFSL